MENKHRLFLYVFFGALFFMLDAFINGYPIVYSDTSTYLASGFDLETPFDRPITYGLFVRLFSLNGVSLWLVVFAQAFMLSFLVFQVVKILVNNERYLKIGLYTILFLSLFTGVSWTVSQIMPDIFTSMALLCFVVILFGTHDRKTQIILYLLFFISVAMHISHLLLFFLIGATVFFFKTKWFPKKEHSGARMKVLVAVLLMALSLITMGSALSKSKHVFFMGAMVEHGILKTYLDETCATQSYRLCRYKDSLPQKAYQFIWDEKSPFYKMGAWKETKKEFNEIILATFMNPKYLFLHIQESLKATIQQLSLFAIGDGNGCFTEGTLLYKRIQKYVPNDAKGYALSKQNKSQLGFVSFFNTLFTATLLLSVLVVFYFFAKSRKEYPIWSIGVLFFIAIVFNAWDCGTFANAIDRLGCKMIWLLPFFAFVFLAQKVNQVKANEVPL
ncbi:MAG: hypothetical protein JST67_09145 [Bacteroidetes bacterium]|nr:hypothetical protein [Bacteroidota bacterium]